MVSENDANQTCPLEPNSCAEFSRHKSRPRRVGGSDVLVHQARPRVRAARQADLIPEGPPGVIVPPLTVSAQ